MPINNNNKLKKRTYKTRSKDDAHYVDNKEFYRVFVIYHGKYQQAISENKLPPKLPDYIGSCFLKIAEKYSHHASFRNYPFRDEMISDAIENCVLYAHDFDPKRGSNPFAYFTQVTWNAFVRRINKENRNKYLTYKSHQLQAIQTGLDGSEYNSSSSGGSASESGPAHRPQDLYENINSFVEDYERKARDKRAEKKKRLAILKNTPAVETKRQAFKKSAKTKK